MPFVFLPVLFLATSAHATRVTHVFGGVVTFVDPHSELVDQSAVGERFQYTVSYDTGVERSDPFGPPTVPGEEPTVDWTRLLYRAETRLIEPSIPGAELFEYTTPVTTFEFALGGRVLDRFVAPTEPFSMSERVYFDGLSIYVYNDYIAAGTGTSLLDRISFGHARLEDDSRSAFSDSSLPLGLQLSDFDRADLFFLEALRGGALILDTIRGPIDSVTSSVVIPEPRTSLFLGVGLLVLGGRRSIAVDRQVQTA